MSKMTGTNNSGTLPSGRVLRQRIDNGDALLGFCLTLPAPEILELAKGYDWFWIDGQHGQLSYDTILHCVRVAELVAVPSIVRTVGQECSQIGLALDTGASGVMVPMIHNAEQARAVATATKFPPIGQRSFGGRRVMDQSGGKYAATANKDTLVLGQIESVEGLANVEEIAAVAGMDGLFFGPCDYALDSGMDIESAANLSEPAVWEAAEKIAASCAKHGKVACSLAGSCETAARLAKVGYQMLGVSLDATLLSSGMSDNLAGFQRALKES